MTALIAKPFRATGARVAVFAVLALTLSACSSPYSWNRRTGEDIDQTLTRARKTAAKPAPVPADVNQALLPPLVVPLPDGSTAPIEPRFDLTVNNAPARQVFMGLVEGTRYSMVVHPDVSGTMSLNLKDVTVPQALDAIRKVYGYDYQRDGNRFLILGRGLQTRMFPVNYLNLIRNGRSDTRVASNGLSKSGTSTTTSSGAVTGTTSAVAGIQVETKSQEDFWKNLEATIKGIVGTGPGRAVVVNPDAGLVVVRAMPDELRIVHDFLGATQASVNRQVVLEAKIIEVDLNSGFQTGINWAHLGKAGDTNITSAQIGGGSIFNGTGTSDIAGNAGNLNPSSYSAVTGTATSAFGGVFTLALQSNHFASFFELLQTQGKVHVLSSPRVSTVNGQKAVIKVGSDEFFVTSTTSTPSSVAGVLPTVTAELTPFFSGIALDVTPQIDDVGNIVLHIHPSVSDVSQKTISVSVAGAGNFTLPSALSSIQESDNVVRAGSGQVIVIGGLMKEGSTDDDASVPLLGDIPILGNLFKHKKVTRIKKELVILLKPTVIGDDNAWGRLVEDSQRRVDQIRRER